MNSPKTYKQDKAWIYQAINALGMSGEKGALISSIRADSFDWIRTTFGFVLLYDAWTSLTGVHMAWAGQQFGIAPDNGWLSMLMIFFAFVKITMAISMLANKGVKTMACVGLLYFLFDWVFYFHGGDYGLDGTDPGAGMAYILVFVFILAAERGKEVDPSRNELMTFARVSLGILWTYDAMMKFHENFLFHFISYLEDAQKDTAGTLVGSIIHIWIVLVNTLNPVVVGFAVAILEAAIAFSLLTTKGIRILAPLGFLLSIGIFTSAEEFGGPYTNFITSHGDALLGTACIYLFLLAYIMVLYNPLDLFKNINKV